MIKPLEEVTPIYDSVQAYVFVSCLSGLRSHRQSHRSLQIMETIRGIFFVILNQQVKTLAFLLFAGVPIKWEWKLIFLKEKSQFFFRRNLPYEVKITHTKIFEKISLFWMFLEEVTPFCDSVQVHVFVSNPDGSSKPVPVQPVLHTFCRSPIHKEELTKRYFLVDGPCKSLVIDEKISCK